MTLYIPKIIILIEFLINKLIPLLISVAYYTLLERKLMASIQRRKGPNVLGFWGSLQPLADGLKLFLKENIIPYKSNKILFLLAPV
jgi:NADH:ubiquinone oxidoreductase subunit H